MIKFPLAVVMTAVDKWTASLTKMTAGVSAAFKPITDAGKSIGEWGKANGFARVTEALGGVQSAVWNTVKAFSIGFLAIGGALADVGYALFHIVEGTVAAGDAALKNSQKAGMALGTFQELAYAAKLAGIEQGDFANVMSKFSRNVGLVALGNHKAAEGFRRLGINVFDAHHKLRPVEELLGVVADRLPLLADQGKRNAISAMLFGKGFASLSHFLHEGSEGMREAADEARRLGIVFSPAQAAAAVHFERRLIALKSAFAGVRNVIGLALMPAFERLIEVIMELVERYRPQIEAWAKRFAEKLPERLAKLGHWVQDLTDHLLPLVEAFIKVIDWIGPTNAILLALGATILVTVVPAVISLVASLYTLSAALAATPVGWIILGIAAAIALTVGGLVKMYFEIKWVMAQWAALAGWVERHWAVLDTFFTVLWDGIKAKFTDAYDWIAAKVTAIVDLIPEWLRESGSFAVKAALTPAASSARIIGAAVGAASGGQSSVKVEFANVPRGTRVTEMRSDGPELDLSMGYSMVGGN